MAVFQLLERKLKEKLVYSCYTGRWFQVASIELLDEKTEPEDSTLYITCEKTASTVLQKRKGSFSGLSVILLVSARPSSNSVLQELCKKYGISLIMAEYSEQGLSICAAQAMNYYLMADGFFQSVHVCQDITEIIRKLSGYLGEEVMLVNSFGNPVFRTSGLGSTEKQMMLNRFYDIISRNQNNNLAGWQKGGPDEGFLYVKLHQNHNLYGVLFIDLSHGIPHDYEYLLQKLVPDMTRVIFTDVRTNPNVPPRFALIWKDIMEGKYSSSEELKKRFAHSGYKTRRFYRLMVLQLNQPVEQLEYIYLQTYPLLKSLFPDGLLTLYLGTIVVMDWADERTYELSLSQEEMERLETLLLEYNGWMCVGWSSRNMTWIPPLYQFSHKILNMRYQMVDGRNPSRVIPFSTYCPFLLVDMCAQHLRSTGDIRDIMLLTHPAVINLFRYDMEHNTNLELVLYHYIINHRSLEQTAASLYMHRNTVVNKIRKIRSMINADLDDPQIQSHLVMSHFTLRYCINIIDPNFVKDTN